MIQDRLQAIAGVKADGVVLEQYIDKYLRLWKRQEHCNLPIRMLLLALRRDQAANHLCFVQTKLRSQFDAIF